MHSIFALLLLFLLSPSCSGPVDFEPSPGQLEVRSVPPNLVLTNTGDEAIYYQAFEADFAARALFTPCTDPDRCPRLDAGKEKQLPLTDVPGYERGRAQRVIVYWWHLVPEDKGGWRVEGFQSVNLSVSGG